MSNDYFVPDIAVNIEDKIITVDGGWRVLDRTTQAMIDGTLPTPGEDRSIDEARQARISRARRFLSVLVDQWQLERDNHAFDARTSANMMADAWIKIREAERS